MASLGMTAEHATAPGGSSTVSSVSAGSGTAGNCPRVMGLSVQSGAPDVIYDTSQKDIHTTMLTSPINYKRCFGTTMNRSDGGMKKSICKKDGPDPYNRSKVNPWMERKKGSNGRSTFTTSPVPRFSGILVAPQWFRTVCRLLFFVIGCFDLFSFFTSAFGTTTEKGYSKGRNLGSKNLQEQFRFFKDTSVPVVGQQQRW